MTQGNKNARLHGADFRALKAYLKAASGALETARGDTCRARELLRQWRDGNRQLQRGAGLIADAMLIPLSADTDCIGAEAQTAIAQRNQ